MIRIALALTLLSINLIYATEETQQAAVKHNFSTAIKEIFEQFDKSLLQNPASDFQNYQTGIFRLICSFQRAGESHLYKDWYNQETERLRREIKTSDNSAIFIPEFEILTHLSNLAVQEAEREAQ